MGTPKPGDFPLGSVESRAAMRLQLSSEREAQSTERRATFSVGGIVAYGPVTFSVGKFAEEFFAHRESEREHT
jgi:hypothetical protein